MVDCFKYSFSTLKNKKKVIERLPFFFILYKKVVQDLVSELFQ
jgi:hypothetical protein